MVASSQTMVLGKCRLAELWEEQIYIFVGEMFCKNSRPLREREREWERERRKRRRERGVVGVEEGDQWKWER